MLYIFYAIYYIGRQSENGFKIGLSVKDETPLLDVGFNKKFKQDDLEYIVGLSFKSKIICSKEDIIPSSKLLEKNHYPDNKTMYNEVKNFFLIPWHQ